MAGMTRSIFLVSLVLSVACGADDDDDDSIGTDAGLDAGLDAAPGQDAGGDTDAATDAGPVEDECPAPPDDLPDVTITADERYTYLDVFEYPGLEPRSVTVVVPEGYDEGAERYPVVYLMDGIVALGVWGATTTLDDLAAEGAIPPHILVAINSTTKRLWELTPDAYEDAPEEILPRDDQYPGGGGPAFATLVTDIIKPYVDAHFRTRCGRENTTIGGFSLGGLMCMYFLLEHGDVFGRGLCESGSWWWNEGAEVEALRAFAGPMPVRLWVDVGTAEALEPLPGYNIGMVNRAREVRDVAIERGMVLGEDLGYYEQPDAPHDFAFGGLRLPLALEFLLSDLTVTTDQADSLEVHLFQTDLATPARGDWLDACETSATLGWGERTRMTWPNDEASFSSTDPEVATVDASGHVTAVSAGSATIEATLAGHSASDDVEVH